MTPLLGVDRLVTEIATPRGAIRAVDGVSLRVERGESVALVGESGSGKSMTAFSLMRLFPTRGARVSGGRITFEDRNLLDLGDDEMRALRGARMSMVFQDPTTFLDPLMPVGAQVAEPLRAHKSVAPEAVDARVIELLDQMGLPDPAGTARRYPHQLSGGQRQRAMIASAIACHPALLIADEPTTALDVTVQAQIMTLLRRLRREMGLALLLITHDLGLVASLCDRVYVMYAGRIVETNTTEALFRAPRHPYTQALLRCTLTTAAITPLFTIPGNVPNLAHPPAGCRFHPRCPLADERCKHEAPPLEGAGDGQAACWRADEALAGDIWGQS